MNLVVDRMNEGIVTESVPYCIVCGCKGEPLYEELRDRLFAAPGVWSLVRCHSCGLVWLNQRPVPEHLAKIYANYHTHKPKLPSIPVRRLRRKVKQAVLAEAFGYEQLANGRKWQWVGRIVSRIPPLKERVGASVLFLEWTPQGKVVDVGCGSGGFLATLRDLGWSVRGVEPDPEAARLARQLHGLPVITGTLEDAGLPDGSVDAITLSHVIEHVYDPVSLLEQCYRLLRAGGRLVAVTPNINSSWHQFFQHCWRGLEPPRHFHLFSELALRTCAERANFRVDLLRTNSFGSRRIWSESREIQHLNGNGQKKGDQGLTWESRLLQVLREVMLHRRRTGGEQLLLLAGKPTADSESGE